MGEGEVHEGLEVGGILGLTCPTFTRSKRTNQAMKKPRSHAHARVVGYHNHSRGAGGAGEFNVSVGEKHLMSAVGRMMSVMGDVSSHNWQVTRRPAGFNEICCV